MSVPPEEIVRLETKLRQLPLRAAVCFVARCGLRAASFRMCQDACGTKAAVLFATGQAGESHLIEMARVVRCAAEVDFHVSFAPAHPEPETVVRAGVSAVNALSELLVAARQPAEVHSELVSGLFADLDVLAQRSAGAAQPDEPVEPDELGPLWPNGEPVWDPRPGGAGFVRRPPEPERDAVFRDWAEYFKQLNEGQIDPKGEHTGQYVAFTQGRVVDFGPNGPRLCEEVAARLQIDPTTIVIAFLG